MNIYLVIFLVAFFIFLFILFKFGNKAHYDERQELIRGRGFKYGFLTMMFVNAILAFVVSEIQLSPKFLLLASIFAGLWIFSIYVIWNSAYFAINQPKGKRLSWIFLLLGLLYGVQSITDLTKTSWNLRSWNSDIGLLMLAIYFVSVGCLMIYCLHRDQKRD